MKLFARPALRIAVALVAVVALLVITVGPVFAHSYLKSVSPADGSVLDAAPDSVVLTFTANVLPDFTQVTVACNGQDLTGLPAPTSSDNVVTQPVGAAAVGACVVTFRIVSADSHPVTGRTTFTVNAPAPTTAAPTTAAPATSPSPGTSEMSPSAASSAAVSTAASSPSPADTSPATAASSSSSWLSTALLILLAAGLLGLFAWLAKGRNRR